MDASDIPESVDFRTFAVNVKTIAPVPKLYQFGHAIWWYREPSIIDTFMESYDFSGKTVVPFATSGGSGMGDTVKNMNALSPNANVVEGKRFSANVSANEIAVWASKWL